MTSPNAAKGKRFEKAVVDFLAERMGRYARRPHAEGFRDVGDVHTPLFALQCKDEQRHDFSGYLRDATSQAEHAGQDYAAAVVKRRRRPIADAYVAMDLRTFRDVSARLDAAEEALRDADPEAWHRHVSTFRP